MHNRRGRRCRRGAGLLVLPMLAICLAACGGSPSTNSASTQQAEYYVSLGDSYAAGYQPSGQGVGSTNTNGFAYQIPALAKGKGYHFNLVNFGCGGATTTSILRSPGCNQLGPGATPYPTETQAAAAEAFLRAHKGHVGLITVSIGGNDVTSCASAASVVTCVTTAVSTIATNLATLLKGLRAAAGRSVPIVGTSYPDVILGLDLPGPTSDPSLAKLSVLAFQKLINPTLSKAYSAVGGRFVDVTAATGAYTPLSQTTVLAPYGRIPVAVAKVCELTFFCQYHDIHPRTAGYEVIAELVYGALPEHTLG